MKNALLRSLPLLVVLAMAAILTCALLNGKKTNEAEGRLVGQKPDFFEIPALNGSHFSPALWEGKVALLNVFASWCIPCAAEHETINKLAQNKKLPVFGLAWRDKANKVSKWLNNHDNPYQSVGVDSEGQTTVALALTGVPETFVFDKSGAIAYHYSGPINDDMVQTVILPLMEKLNAK